MITVNNKENQLQITIPGSTAEYVNIMRALVVAMTCLNEEFTTFEETQNTLGQLLLDMLPEENNLILDEKK